MFYRFVCIVIILNVLYELIEVIFPSKKMKSTVKSFVLVLIFYVICDYLFLIFQK